MTTQSDFAEATLQDDYSKLTAAENYAGLQAAISGILEREDIDDDHADQFMDDLVNAMFRMGLDTDDRVELLTFVQDKVPCSSSRLYELAVDKAIEFIDYDQGDTPSSAHTYGRNLALY